MLLLAQSSNTGLGPVLAQSNTSIGQVLAHSNTSVFDSNSWRSQRARARQQHADDPSAYCVSSLSMVPTAEAVLVAVDSVAGVSALPTLLLLLNAVVVPCQQGWHWEPSDGRLPETEMTVNLREVR